MIFTFSNLNSNLALTLGYLNPALNNSAQEYKKSFLRKPKYPKQYAKLSTTNLTKTCFL